MKHLSVKLRPHKPTIGCIMSTPSRPDVLLAGPMPAQVARGDPQAALQSAASGSTSKDSQRTAPVYPYPEPPPAPEASAAAPRTAVATRAIFAARRLPPGSILPKQQQSAPPAPEPAALPVAPAAARFAHACLVPRIGGLPPMFCSFPHACVRIRVAQCIHASGCFVLRPLVAPAPQQSRRGARKDQGLGGRRGHARRRALGSRGVGA